MRNALLLSSLLLVGVGLGIGCERERTEPTQAPAPAPEQAPTVEPAPQAAPTPTAEPAAASDDEPGEEAEVQVEEAEATPESPNVRLRLEVHPKAIRTKVYWGRKLLGAAPLDFERPRRSGPLELVIVADNYLDYHTRMFTDRDETLTVRLVHVSEQHTLLGYRQTADGGVPLGRSPDAGVAPTGSSAR